MKLLDPARSSYPAIYTSHVDRHHLLSLLRASERRDTRWFSLKINVTFHMILQKLHIKILRKMDKFSQHLLFQNLTMQSQDKWLWVVFNWETEVFINKTVLGFSYSVSYLHIYKYLTYTKNKKIWFLLIRNVFFLFTIDTCIISWQNCTYIDLL